MQFAANFGVKPEWLTFDCYGTLIQWDEGLVGAVTKILVRKSGLKVSVKVVDKSSSSNLSV